MSLQRQMMFLEAKAKCSTFEACPVGGRRKIESCDHYRILTDFIRRSGSKTVWELHGSIHRNYCQKCGKFYDASYVKHADGVPRCECGG